MLILALDTSEARGSVALVRDREPIAAVEHPSEVDYSAWLLPAVEGLFDQASRNMRSVDLLAVATGPGSFTGLRVGLTTVKAWAEVYGKPVVGVSRLEALARSRQSESAIFKAAFYDAQRGQIFSALYESSRGTLARIADELVAAPEDFLSFVETHAPRAAVNWLSLDPQLITNLPGWKARVNAGDTVSLCSSELATEIAKVAEESARVGRFTDLLALDANYVRRSDAEIFWKGR